MNINIAIQVRTPDVQGQQVVYRQETYNSTSTGDSDEEDRDGDGLQKNVKLFISLIDISRQLRSQNDLCSSRPDSVPVWQLTSSFDYSFNVWHFKVTEKNNNIILDTKLYAQQNNSDSTLFYSLIVIQPCHLFDSLNFIEQVSKTDLNSQQIITLSIYFRFPKQNSDYINSSLSIASEQEV